MEFPIVEGDASCVIKTAEAYSSVYDNTAKWPENNFTKVAKEELAKKPFDCLVMSAPTVDITNIDTSNLKQSDNTTRYQEIVLISCQNIFSGAGQSLKENPNLKNVVIMEHAPRYDTREIDPTGLQEALAKYANNIFNQLWMDSRFKNKITIGSHVLITGNAGPAHDDIFRSSQTGKYDGVHHYGKAGKKLYSKSVGGILRQSLSNGGQSEVSPVSKNQNYHKKRCPQAVFQKKQNKNQARNQASVKVSNRF